MKAVLLHSYTRHSKQTNQSIPKHQQQKTSLSFSAALTGPIVLTGETMWERSDLQGQLTVKELALKHCGSGLLSFTFSAKHTRLVHNMGSLAKNYRFEPMTSYKHGSGRSYPLILQMTEVQRRNVAAQQTAMQLILFSSSADSKHGI